MVFGGVVINAELEGQIRSHLARVREQHKTFGEVKWVKISRSKLDFYSDFVNSLHKFSSDMHYKALVVDTAKIDYGTYHDGDREKAFYKFYWQLLYHKVCRPYMKSAREVFYVSLDEKKSPYSLDELRTYLNRALWKHHWSSPVKSLSHVKSHQSDILQLVDVITGAVAAHANGRDKAEGASPARIAIGNLICGIAKLDRLCKQTPFLARKFEVWRWEPRKK